MNCEEETCIFPSDSFLHYVISCKFDFQKMFNKASALQVHGKLKISSPCGKGDLKRWWVCEEQICFLCAFEYLNTWNLIIASMTQK